MTERVPLEVRDDVAVILPIVAVPPRSVEIPEVTALKVVAKRLEEVALVKVALVAVSVVKIAVAALRRVAKRLEEVALVLRRLVIVPSVTVSFVIVVVARVEVPTIRSVPLARRLPLGSAKKLRFSVQADPFQ